MENNMKNILKINGKSVVSIIKEAGVSKSTFYSILNGNQVPKIDTAIRIATALDVDVQEIFPQLKRGGGSN